MKQIYYTFRSLSQNKAATTIKVLSLTLGLGMSIILFAGIAYTLSYNKCLRDYDSIYQLMMQFETAGNKSDITRQCYGKLAGSLYEELPDVIESAVAMRDLGNCFDMADGRNLPYFTTAADSLFFETMGINVISGNPRLDLQQNDVIYVSTRMVDEVFHGENPVGTQLIRGHDKATIKGVFEALPANCDITCDIVLSLPSLLNRGIGYFGWDGGSGWTEFVRLKDKDIDPERLHALINQVTERHTPPADDNSCETFAVSIRDNILKNSDIRHRLMILGALALALFLITALNYALMSISTLSKRAKAIGVHKCCGADSNTIFGMFVWETVTITLIALLLMGIMLGLFNDTISEFTGDPLTEMLNADRAWVIVVVALMMVAVGAAIPGRLFARVPVSQVFRRFSERNNGWKRVLLFIELVGVSFVFAWLCATSLQYRHLRTADKGYDSDLLVQVENMTLDISPEAVYNFIRSHQAVEGIASSYSCPAFGYSGEYIRDVNGNIIFSSRTDDCSPNYVEVMGMTLLAGRAPQQEGEAIVNQEFLRQSGLPENTSPTAGEGLFTNAERGRVRITGIVKDFNIGGFYDEQEPIIMHYIGNPASPFTVRLKQPVNESIKLLNESLGDYMGNDGFWILQVSELGANGYSSIKIMIFIFSLAIIIIVIITSMGMIGFINDEIQRKSKEIAIRKINGATAREVVELLCSNMLKTAVPAVAIGTLAAWFFQRAWFSQYSTVVSGIGLWYVAIALLIIIVVIAVVALMTQRIAKENPVTSLRNE